MAVETLLFSGAGGFAIGAISGYALKRIIKIAAIILGAFFLGLAYLSYKGWVHADWNVIQTQTYTGIMNVTQGAQQYIHSTMHQVSSHPVMLQGQGITVAAGLGFLPGLFVGLKH